MYVDVARFATITREERTQSSRCFHPKPDIGSHTESYRVNGAIQRLQMDCNRLLDGK